MLIFCILSSLSLVGCNSDSVGENTPSSSESTPPDSETVQPNESPVSDFKIFVNDSRASINGYFGTDKTVVIPERIVGKPVTGISNFANNENIEKVVIPSTVTCIWEYAFANCSSLKEVVFGDGITEICQRLSRTAPPWRKINSRIWQKLGYKAFRNCTSLKKVFIPKSLTEMGHTVFANCSISELTFEDGIKTIGASAAFWCGDNLKSVTIPASVEEIGDAPFDDELGKGRSFLGDAPKKIGKQPFGENTVIYYKKGTNGWEDTPLKDSTLVELQ